MYEATEQPDLPAGWSMWLQMHKVAAWATSFEVFHSMEPNSIVNAASPHSNWMQHSSSYTFPGPEPAQISLHILSAPQHR